MTKKISYLLLQKDELRMTKDDFLKIIKEGSDSPKECRIFCATKLRDKHIDFIHYCELFKMFYRPSYYYIVYAPESYMSYYLMRYQDQVKGCLSVTDKNFITPEVAALYYEYKKVGYSRPSDTPDAVSVRMAECEKKIHDLLVFC